MADAATAGQSAPPTGRIYLYFAPLTLLVYLALPTGYLLDIVTAYLLKNQLHATAIEVSTFRLVTAIPVYFSFIFGFTRDLWNPFGLRDRGYLLIFAPISAAVFLFMGFAHLSYASMVIGMLLVMVTFRFISAAYWGLIALVGQEKLMSGRLSALWNILGSLPYIVGGFVSGWVADNLRPTTIFMVVAAICVAVALFGLWRPKAVFHDAYNAPQAKGADLWGDIRRLFRHRAIYPAVLMIFMFQFAPGSNTPLQYYLSNTLHAPDEVYGLYQGIFAASFIPIFFLYGWLCKRVSLEKLLWWGLIITVPQMIPLALIHSGNQALMLAVPIGMLGGVAAAAIYDLAMRSCPPGLQGTMMMLIEAGNLLSARGSDLLGSKIYAADPVHGFVYCVAATTAVYALIVPVILLVPKKLMATADGEANPEVEAEILAEIAETAPAG
ncbi:MAG TPA: MFS transporter [Caulobacteraceae bacterium]|jgi:MFS family permease|nr:MFS transporter [Caulobacteraceae bacterium]